MLRKSQKDFRLQRALIFLTTLGIYCETNEIYNSTAAHINKIKIIENYCL